MQSIKTVWILRLALIMAGVASFITSYRYFDLGLPYAAETSSNPNPSEVARVMGPRMMDHGIKWLYAAIACLGIFGATFLLRRRPKTPELS